MLEYKLRLSYFSVPNKKYDNPTSVTGLKVVVNMAYSNILMEFPHTLKSVLAYLVPKSKESNILNFKPVLNHINAKRHLQL